MPRLSSFTNLGIDALQPGTISSCLSPIRAEAYWSQARLGKTATAERLDNSRVFLNDDLDSDS